jgi:proteasome accessory factor B
VDAAFEPLTAAARVRKAVTFSYRVPEDDAPTVRHLHPWGVVCWRGRWYVVGHDTDRDAPRCFRLSRIVGQVRQIGPPRAFAPPVDLDLISYVARWSGPVERNRITRVLVREGRAAGVRRWAQNCTPTVDGDVLELRYADAESFAAWLVGYGADVTVLEPAEVREATIARLQEIAGISRDLAEVGT